MVRFFGANDEFTLTEIIEFLEAHRSTQFHWAGVARLKPERERAFYAERLLGTIIEEIEQARDNGATPLYILEKLEKAPKGDPHIVGLDDIQDSILPGGRFYATGEAPENTVLFLQWLAAHWMDVLYIQEIFPGNFGVGQFVLSAEQIRRVVQISAAQTIVLRRRNNDGTVGSSHWFDRQAWLALTDPGAILHESEIAVMGRLALSTDRRP
jgi:hypothetical protein